MIQRRTKSLLAGLHCTVALWAMPVAAQNTVAVPATQEPVAGRIDDIVVTARRVEENIQRVPVAVTAIGGEQLDRLVVNNVQDLNKLAPGLQTGGCSGTRNDCTPVIRGQGAAFATGRSSVVNYFAEAPNFQVSYYDLASLQVVKGPQGTLFGETATGGVLIYTPRKPTNDFDGYIQVQGGNYDYRALEGAIGGALIDDVLQVRLAGQYRKRDGFTKAFSSFGARPTDFDNIDRTQLRLSVVFSPFDNFENYTVFALSDDHSNGNSSPLYYVDTRYLNPAIRNIPLSLVPSLAAAYEFGTGTPPPAGLSYAQILAAAQTRQLAAGPRRTFYNYSRQRDTKFRGFVNTTKWDVLDGALSIKNIFALQWTKSRGPTLDVDGSDFPLVDTRAPFVPGTTSITSGRYAYTGGWPSREWTNETQLLGSLFEDRLQWQAGFYYRYAARRNWDPNQGIISVFTATQGDPAPASFCTAAGVASPCTAIDRSKSISYAGFAQGTFALTPELKLTGGYRRTWDKRLTETTATTPYTVNFKGQTFYIPVVGRDPIAGARVIPTLVPLSHQDTYTLSADWQVTPDALLYIARRTGYKGGGINGNQLPDSPDRIFGPETLTDMELGGKFDWSLGGVRGRTNIALYRDEYKDIQRSQIVPGTATTVTSNLADARLQGIEIDGTVFLTDWFHLSGNFAYLDAKYKRWTETRICGSQYFRPQCAGLAATTPLVIDHANGVMTINGQTINFTPDKMQDAAKFKWAIQPTIKLEPFTGEDINLGANIYYMSRWTANASNTSDTAGVPVIEQETLLGTKSEPFFRDPVTLVDLRFDWNNIRGSNLSLAASVTNVTNKLVNGSNGGGFTIGGTAPAIFQEPRMFYLQLRYNFGGR